MNNTSPQSNRHLSIATERPSAWEIRWAAVPAEWRTGYYQLDTPLNREIFTFNANYPAWQTFDFRPAGNPRIGQELAWWVYTCWKEGLRKIEPSMLKWWQKAVSTLVASRYRIGDIVLSLTELEPELIIREATAQFYARNHRLPSPNNRRNLESIAEHIYLYLNARTTDNPWWESNIWSLKADDRIPRRQNEPHAHKNLNFNKVHPTWLREGLRFYLAQELIHQNFTWTTLGSRIKSIDNYFGEFLEHQAISTPLLATDHAHLRQLSAEHLSWLRAYRSKRNGQLISSNTIAAAQSHVQTFYNYMYENKEIAALTTGDNRWERLTPDHLRIWAPTNLVKARHSRYTAVKDQYITAEDLSAMAECIKALLTPTTETITLEPVGREPITIKGIYDPQAARCWLLQAATGRRVSEILMLNYNCLTPIEGATDDSPNAFVARLSYQQTKVAGVDPTILVEQYVVELITAQQKWLRDNLNLTDKDPNPEYLFTNPRQDYKGLRPRSYTSHSAVMRRLTAAVKLHDKFGNPLSFSATHRLRHTRATTLLNAGVPIHVVQDYLGHRSPEMTMHYAKTLAKTAEAEFLKAASTGAFGKPLEMSKQDAYEIAQIEGRMDRILPNGMCMLPPTQTCDKGNACLTCTAFATNSTHLDTLQTQRKVTLQLITDRKKLVKEKHGRGMPDDNVWLIARTKEIQSLDSIITALNTTNSLVKGAGTCPRRSSEEELNTDG